MLQVNREKQQIQSTEHQIKNTKPISRNLQTQRSHSQDNNELVVDILQNALDGSKTLEIQLIHISYLISSDFEKFPTIKLRNFLIRIESHEPRKLLFYRTA